MKIALSLFVIMLVAAGGLLAYSGQFPTSMSQVQNLGQLISSPQTFVAMKVETGRLVRGTLGGIGSLHPSLSHFVNGRIMPLLGPTTVPLSLPDDVDEIPTQKTYINDDFELGFYYSNAYVLTEEVSTTSSMVFRIKLEPVAELQKKVDDADIPRMAIDVFNKQPSEMTLEEWVKATPAVNFVRSHDGKMYDTTVLGTPAKRFSWGTETKFAATSVIFYGPNNNFVISMQSRTDTDPVVADYEKLLKLVRPGITKSELQSR